MLQIGRRFFLLSTSASGRVLVEPSALTFPHGQTTLYLMGTLQSIVHVCEILEVARAKSSRSTR